MLIHMENAISSKKNFLKDIKNSKKCNTSKNAVQNYHDFTGIKLYNNTNHKIEKFIANTTKIIKQLNLSSHLEFINPTKNKVNKLKLPITVSIDKTQDKTTTQIAPELIYQFLKLAIKINLNKIETDTSNKIKEIIQEISANINNIQMKIIHKNQKTYMECTIQNTKKTIALQFKHLEKDSITLLTTIHILDLLEITANIPIYNSPYGVKFSTNKIPKTRISIEIITGNEIKKMQLKFTFEIIDILKVDLENINDNNEITINIKIRNAISITITINLNSLKNITYDKYSATVDLSESATQMLEPVWYKF